MTTPAPGQLRVAVLTDDFYPDSGGVCRSIELQVAELVRRGHHVTLISPHVNFTPPPHVDYLTVPTWRLPHTPSHLCSLRWSTRLARRLSRRFSFDVVHSQNERGSMLLAAKLARVQGIPHVHTFHSNYAGTHAAVPLGAALVSVAFLPLVVRLLAGASGRAPVAVRRPPVDPGESSRFAAGDWMALARLASCIDAFTSPAPYVIDTIAAAAGTPTGARGRVVPSGVSGQFVAAERRRGSDGPVRFLSCGRLSAEKRVDQIVRAFNALDRDDVELVVAGGGPDEGQLRALAKQGRPTQVTFTGHIGDVGEVAQTVADADVFVLASYRFDTQGMVLAEAAAAGTPILYCDDRLRVGVGPDNALLVGPDVADLAAGMRALADDRERIAAMAAASATLAPGLTTAAMGERYERVYRDAAARVASETDGAARPDGTGAVRP
ncbi:glycosyltransferase [Nigerium massiliense]|uniref:glycosyltransferase n=1 Tax=Nigerium massiliense TaxID=1522317 RepID=UPI000694F849|nr:glycosyltransferase [Nigerium massiliense]